MGENCLKREFPCEVWEFPFGIGLFEEKTVFEPYIVGGFSLRNLKEAKNQQ
jgi:hypothetical protein